MYWQNNFNKESKDVEIEEMILKIRQTHRDFGYRRIYAELRKNGIVVNKKKVQKIIRMLGLQVCTYTRKSRKRMSYRKNSGKTAVNRINRRFNTHVLHQKITTDTTEFKYYTIDSTGKITIKKLYFDPFMDMFNREIISYSITRNNKLNDVLVALNEAVTITSDCKYRRTFHSDQGFLYRAKKYSAILNSNKIFQSMSRKGNCYDNSVMESFFSIMKQEMYYGVIYNSFEDLSISIKNYVDYYNKKRTKEVLGFMSPVEYRLFTLKN